MKLLPFVALLRQGERFMADPRGESYRSYDLATFRADISGFLRSNQPGAGERLFKWAPGAGTKGALFMLVPGLGRPAHVGRAWFTSGK